MEGVENRMASLQEKVASILKEAELPKRLVLEESHVTAAEITIGRTSFMKLHDVASEYEFKRRCIKENIIMYHAHIGMNTWA